MFRAGSGHQAVPAAVQSAFRATSEGWCFSRSIGNEAAESYVAQLLDEGIATVSEDGAIVGWPALYALLKDDAHASSIPLLQLPSASPHRPILASRGTPSDADFRIGIEAWEHSGQVVQAIDRRGPVIEPDGDARLLPQSAYELLNELERLGAHGRGLTTDERMLAMGRVQKLADRCGAKLDRYLTASPVVVPEDMSIRLQHSQIVETQVLEVIPELPGAPSGWLGQFDRFDTVRCRYDVTGEAGVLSHVVLPKNVREVAQAIKAMPGRRLGGNQAASFVQNPYPFLGEGSEQVIPPEQFERARQEAGLIEWELDLQPQDEGWAAVLVDSAGRRDSEYLGEYDLARARQLLVASNEAQEVGDSAMRWDGYDLALAGLTLESLRRVRQAGLYGAYPGSLGIELMFDLSSYSDRVIGFDGQKILIPKVMRPDNGIDWAPDDAASLVIDSVNTSTGEVISTPLTPVDVQQLTERVQEAEEQQQVTVRVPSLEVDIPTEEARSWVDGLKEASRAPRPVPPPKDPQPSEKLGLKILHNIERLDYNQQGALDTEGHAELELPAALRKQIDLMPHQSAGIAWMQHRLKRRAEGVRGILLADDMGLGKTLQCLCLMAWYRQTAPVPRPCLVVAPVSLLQNWKAEIEKFLDGSQGTTITLYGEHLSEFRLSPREISEELRRRGLKKALRPGFAHGAAFVLTTYETLRDYQLSLAREHWGVLVCDEAQKIKTPSAMVTRAAKAMQADFKIACTGTPVENSLADLWCLFDFFQPGLLDSLSQFTKVFRQAIEQRSEGHEPLVESLRAQIAPWVLRRMKSEVAQLQPKTELPCELPMSARQRALYATAAKEFRQAVESNEGRGGTAVLSLLHRLRIICANPLAAADSQAEYLSVEEHVRHSPKLAWLLDQLETIRQRNEKVIIFTEYRDMQRLLQRAVASRFQIRPAIINGSTSVDPQGEASRQAIIDAFQARPGFGVIVLSTTAVGFGVNIQAANHVVHFTRPWNPAKEDQATDRAYRIGQEREVFVYCPTVTGDGFDSFEQRVAERLSIKRALSSDMLAQEQGISLEEFASLEG